ncbi:PA polymerase subunit [Sinu virus]|uniref:PA polymerase subunit n=1 Tax=Sinu virus TaxID=1927799 RepID=A0A1L5YKG5_9ORTO|nr:PA polymerase subunit [Sinu virus]APP91611.1 PA polymerase subunit [Sinu virus]
MSYGKPDSVEPEVWDTVVREERRKNPRVRFEELLLGVIKFKVMSMINNFHKHNLRDRYLLIYCQDPQVVPSLIGEEDLVIFGNRLPDLRDHKLKIYICIHILVNLDEEEKTKVPLLRMGQEKNLLVSLDGNINEESKLFLDESQIQDIKNLVVKMNVELNTMQVMENLELYMTKGVFNKVVVGSRMRELLMRKTDINFVPDTRQKPLPRLPNMKSWTKMTDLPKIRDNKEQEKEACWRSFLIGSESEYLIAEDIDDSTVCGTFFSEYPNYEIIRNNGSFGVNELKSILLSINTFTQGNARRSKIQEDLKGFGINVKHKKKASEYTSEPFVPFSFDHEKRSPPKWIEKEILDLSGSTDAEWLNLERLRTYTKLDEVSEEGVASFIEIVKNTNVAALIEKWSVACSKLQNELHTDREKITLIPIITRKKILGKKSSQLWGFILLGPHHPRHDSDRVPLMTLEFAKRDDPIKYEKYSYGLLKGESLGLNEEIPFLGRIYSMPKYKLFYFSYLRKVFLQPLNVFSKILLNNATETGEFNPLHDPEIKLHLQRRFVTISTRKWIKLVLSMEFLMCIHNDSQLEGFLANIRRLQMCRHALQERREIYLPIHSAPEDKCSECVLNNPVVIHLATTWNELPMIS